MKFCDACGGILIPKMGSNGTELECRSCKAVYRVESEDLKISAKHSEKTTARINILEKDKTGLPITEILCNKCGHKNAYWWMQQTRSGDEPETRFFKCTKCGNTWREYD